MVARAGCDSSRSRRGARNERGSWHPDSERIDRVMDGYRGVGGVGTAFRMDTAGQARCGHRLPIHADTLDGLSRDTGSGLVLLPYFFHGFGRHLGSPHPDGWSYTVYGAYLWDYPRGTYGGLAPVYEWASHLSKTRHVASAELAWLATATREGDTQAAVGLLLALIIFTISSTCAALGRIIGLRRGLLGLYVVAAGGGTWIWHAISISNLDNLLALAYLPALAAVALDKPTSSKLETPSLPACWRLGSSTRIPSLPFSRCRVVACSS